jgi:hypothetical protein
MALITDATNLQRGMDSQKGEWQVYGLKLGTSAKNAKFSEFTSLGKSLLLTIPPLVLLMTALELCFVDQKIASLYRYAVLQSSTDQLILQVCIPYRAVCLTGLQDCMKLQRMTL